MKYECLIVERFDDGTVVVTLNRPHRLNAMSDKLQDELEQILNLVENDEDIRVLVITGAPRPDGRPCFCAGEDLHEISTRPEESKQEQLEGMVHVSRGASYGNKAADLARRIERMAKPSIAAIDGVCTAAGLELALSCDLRLVSETAWIAELEMKNLGGVGAAGVPVRLARAIGIAKAKELVFTGDPLDGQQAVEIGLANSVYPPDRLLNEAKALAQKIGTRRAEGLAIAKAIIDYAADQSLDESLRFSYAAALPLMGREGARAFVQKRPPSFTESQVDGSS